MCESVQRVVNDRPDSLEIGTPGKGGAIKVYGDTSKLEEWEARIDAALMAREYANKRLTELEASQ